MFQLLLLLIAAVTPGPDLRALASPDFRTRERAQQALTRALDWPLAVRLTLAPPREPEARYRARLAVQSWYRGQTWEPSRPWPYIDALNAHQPCEIPNTEFVAHYLARARWAPGCYGSLADYRCATALLVDDARQSLVPPSAIRGLLLRMERESAAWDARQRQRMPQTVEPPLAVVPMGP
jgi:hypothetical protein